MPAIRKISLFSLIFVLCAPWLSGCAVNPVTGERDFVLMSEEQEINLGKTYHPQIIRQYGAYEDPALQAYVSRVGEALAAKSHRGDLIFRFTVLDSPMVNAFALPGGYIYITRGIMAYLNSEAELAGVLGHEIGHVTARHGVRQQATATVAGIFSAVVAAETGSQAIGDLSQILGGALLSGYGRSYELQADRLGAEYLERIGYDAENMIEVIGVLKDQEEFSKQRAQDEGEEAQTYHGVFATHPRNDERLQEVIAAAKKYQTDAEQDPDRLEYLKVIEGTIYGDSPEQGIVRNDTFYHSKLGVALELPEDWRIDNQPAQLVMTSRDKNAFMQLTVNDLNKRETPEQYLARILNNPNAQQARSLEISSLPAYTLLAEVNTNVGRRPGRFTVIFKDNRAYLLAGLVENSGDLARFDDIFLATATSFHTLTDKERELARPYRIQLYTVKPGDTYASLAKKTPFPNYREERLRLINGQYPDGEPEPGTIIKLVQ
jgi:predicted Zn-dependent protease